MSLETRLNGNIGSRVNGEMAYISKDKKKFYGMFSPQHKQEQSPIESWKLLFTDHMIEKITLNTDV